MGVGGAQVGQGIGQAPVANTGANVTSVAPDSTGTIQADPTTGAVLLGVVPGSVGLIKVVAHNAVSNYTTASASFAAVDSTNLNISGVVPPTGKILLRFTALVEDTGATGLQFGFAAHNVTTPVQSNYVYALGSNNTVSQPFVITGLTPGATFSYDWLWALGTGIGPGTMFTAVGVGTPLMEAWAAA